MDNLKVLKRDTLRYKKNSLPANLALLGLLFNCLYFCILYGFKTSTMSIDGETQTTWFATILIGASVILTLVMLLVNFLASEGIKGYKKHFCIVLLVLAAVQIARIFIYPSYVLKYSEQFNLTYFWIPGNGTLPGIMMIVWLCASAACLIASAIIGYINCRELESHLAEVESGKVNMDEFFARDRDEIVASTSADNSVKEVE